MEKKPENPDINQFVEDFLKNQRQENIQKKYSCGNSKNVANEHEENLNLKEFFTTAGLSKRHLRNKETRRFICDFIKYHITPLLDESGEIKHFAKNGCKILSELTATENSEQMNEETWIKNLLQNAMITKEQLQDDDTRKFIMDFIESQASDNKAKPVTNKKKPAPKPPTPPPHRQPMSSNKSTTENTYKPPLRPPLRIESKMPKDVEKSNEDISKFTVEVENCVELRKKIPLPAPRRHIPGNPV